MVVAMAGPLRAIIQTIRKPIVPKNGRPPPVGAIWISVKSNFNWRGTFAITIFPRIQIVFAYLLLVECCVLMLGVGNHSV